MSYSNKFFIPQIGCPEAEKNGDFNDQDLLYGPWLKTTIPSRRSVLRGQNGNSDWRVPVERKDSYDLVEAARQYRQQSWTAGKVHRAPGVGAKEILGKEKELKCRNLREEISADGEILGDCLGDKIVNVSEDFSVANGGGLVSTSDFVFKSKRETKSTNALTISNSIGLGLISSGVSLSSRPDVTVSGEFLKLPGTGPILNNILGPMEDVSKNADIGGVEEKSSGLNKEGCGPSEDALFGHDSTKTTGHKKGRWKRVERNEPGDLDTINLMTICGKRQNSEEEGIFKDGAKLPRTDASYSSTELFLSVGQSFPARRSP
ncbi:hypothetical protein Q3G72_008341 [Acer saccharum]|nr:hypothetical protein Q3G72_008341 [Acer saccharum]